MYLMILNWLPIAMWPCATKPVWCDLMRME